MSAAQSLTPAIQQLVEKGLFERLPATFATYSFDRIRGWDLLFPAEQNYFERLFGLLDRTPPPVVDELFAPLRDVEKKMNVSERNWNRREFTLAHVDFLNRSPHYAEWRASVSRIFSRIDPVLDEELSRSGRPRLVIVTSPAELPVGPERMWSRIAGRGKRIAITGSDSPGYLARMLARGGLVSAYTGGRAVSPYDTWLIEAGRNLATFAGKAVHLSYDSLHDYRTRLMAEVRRMVESEKIAGPRQLGERLRKITMDSGNPAIDRTPLMRDFVRSVLLNGNGTLLINNTFVEWASIQAVRRARPSVVAVSFGIRSKVKPFSSLLIYSDQETATPVPTQMDTLGSYVDLEIFYLYLWQEFEKYAEYRRNTAYLFVGDGMEEILVMAPQDFPLLARSGAVTLESVHTDCRAWLNLS